MNSIAIVKQQEPGKTRLQSVIAMAGWGLLVKQQGSGDPLEIFDFAEGSGSYFRPFS